MGMGRESRQGLGAGGRTGVLPGSGLRGRAGMLALALVAALSAGPAIAAPSLLPVSLATPATGAGLSRTRPLGEGTAFRVRTQPLALTPINLDVSRFAFTAPGRVPSTRMQTVERGFSFTPSGSPGKGVSVGVTARSAQAGRTVEAGIAPSASTVDLSVGYKGFALSGGVSRTDMGLGGARREGVDLGLSYGARNWRTSVLATAERGTSPLARPAADESEHYGLQAGSVFALSPQLSVGGTVRYRMAPQNPTPLDPNKDDRAVFVGGSLAF